MQNELLSRIKACINLLVKKLDSTSIEPILENNIDNSYNLTRLTLEMSMYLSEFNFYPSESSVKCCEVAFFTSLAGKRWKLSKKDRLSFGEMFKLIIQHCQGNCTGCTKHVIIITDNWDDDIADFWQPNLKRLKLNGINIEINLLVGKNVNTSIL